jgi:hypothetical protein
MYEFQLTEEPILIEVSGLGNKCCPIKLPRALTWEKGAFDMRDQKLGPLPSPMKL